MRVTRARRLCATLFSLLTVALAPQGWSLGLGEIELDSALNQEFSATIELLDASGLEPAEILVSLGSSEDFERVGVERFFFLTDLDFQVDYGPSGEPIIRVTSGRPITEPYLNFLVEVLWPSGRMLKEYTVLLDPPTFSQAAAPAVSAPAQSRPATTGRVERAGTRVQVAPTGAPSQPSPLDRGFDGDEYGMTDRNDTLWSIASRARPSNAISVQQTMLAIQRMNPEAFINGNINLLKAGYVLRLPDEAEARALSAQEALGEVARHHDEWQAYNRGELVAERTRPAAAPVADQTSNLRSPVDASSATAPATTAPATEGELRIVAEDGDSTTGVGSQALSSDLESALEETDRLGRQVDELTYQLDREKDLATNEIAIRERQIEVKDAQIAELQAQLAAARQAAQQGSSISPATAGQPDQTQSQDQSTQTEASAPWWQSPYVMYGGAGVLVLLLVGGMITARKRRAAEEEDDYFDAEEAFAEDERLEPVLASVDVEDRFDEDEGAMAALGSAEADEDFDVELDGSQTSDVIGEADIYIAYGRFPQAIGLLIGVLEDDPERNDARMKLLEVYAETGDRAAFDTHLAALVEHCDDEEALLSARELESRMGEESVTLDEVMADDEATDAGAAAVVAEAAEELGADASALNADDGHEKVAGSSALDFELELDEPDEAEPAAAEAEIDESPETVTAAAGGAGDELGGDLGIDFNPDADMDAAGADVAAEEATTTIGTTVGFESSTGAEDDSAFGETEELTIDAELEEAAASISSEAAAVGTEEETEGDLATAIKLDDLEFEATAEADEEFDFQDEGDSANTKLDLARAYIDMGDADGARDILREVLDEGNADQQQKAQSMLEAL